MCAHVKDFFQRPQTLTSLQHEVTVSANELPVREESTVHSLNKTVSFILNAETYP